jgi:general secretion pathway protein E
MTFARGLRAILRQDPDVLMVGEMRDLETAGIAVEASLTGHLVFSTLHTNTAVGALVRLQDMGVAPYLLASSLIGVVAQRLVRVLCPECKQAVEADDAEMKLLSVSAGKRPLLHKPVGCPACNHNGYSGRRGIYELLTLDDQSRQMIHDQCSEMQLEAYVRQSMPSIRDDGVRLVLEGLTSLDEVLQVTREDNR